MDNNEVGEDQLLKYIKQAKEHNIDAVITITNQFVAKPTHHPVPISSKNLKSIDIFHWSWTYITAQAELLLRQDKIASQDQRFILHEVVKYLQDPSSGKAGFTSMNEEWKDVVQSIFNSSKLSKTSEGVINTVKSWHQEQREICLQMWPLVGEQVDVKLSRSHRNDPSQRLSDDCEELVKNQLLKSIIEVPNAASDLTVTVDIVRKSVTCSMRLEAPKDKKSTSAKTNWLTRQLPVNEKNDGLSIKAIRQGKAQDTDKPIEDVRQDPSVLEADNTNTPPVSFEIFISQALGGKFSGRRVFIEILENLVPYFYENAGQYLKAWVPPAPRIKRSEKEPEEETEAPITGDHSEG